MLSTFVSLVAAASVVTPAPAHQLLTEDGARVRAETGVLSAPLTGELPAAVRAWALSQRERYGLSPGTTLESSDAFGTRFGASFHLLQTVRGVPVYGAKLVVTLDDQRRVSLVTSSLESVARVLDGAALTTDDAMRRAAEGLPLVALRPDGVPYGGAKRFYFRVGDELHLGWLANVGTLDMTKNLYVAFDAVTGQRLFTQDRVHHAALDAHVYPVSPGGLDAGVGATPTVTRALVHADGGSMVGDTCAVPMPDGGIETYPNDGGELCGTQLMMYNCCPTEGCAPDAGARRVAGAINYGGFPVQFDVAVCDRVRRASNVTNASGDFVYTPVDPPTNPAAVEASDPSNSDEFAEVHSFYHVNTVYDWVRHLSTKADAVYGGTPAIAAFSMRDERPSYRMPPQKVAVWSNVMFPNFNELISGGFGCIAQPPCRADTLLRMDNAAFFPRENFAQLPIPGFDTGVDTLMIFQGNSADAAYDATVIQHEFGHGVVYSTANISFDSIAIDTKSANNEGGALHEGFADYIAAAFNNLAGVGPYFGPRALAGAGVPGVMQNSYLRTMANTLACPDVLWGEVHQDSQHVAGALWEARAQHFQGTDSGDTYDAAFYAMLVGITPDADFAMVAMVMADRVKNAFPTIANAETTMNDIFAQRGVVSCSKVLDFPAGSQARPYYGIATASSLQSSVIPGPFQFKIPAPMGASKVTLTGTVPQGNPLAGNGPTPQLLVKGGSPITFTRMGSTLVNTADASGMAPNGMGSVNVNVPCGQDVYVTIGAQGGGATLQNVSVSITPLASCTPEMDAGTDAGMDDAGTGGGGGGGDTTTIPAVGDGGLLNQNAAKTGCGCSTPVDAGGFGLLALLALRRRQRR